MFDTRTRLFFFAYLKDAAGAALKNAAPANKNIAPAPQHGINLFWPLNFNIQCI